METEAPSAPARRVPNTCSKRSSGRDGVEEERQKEEEEEEE